MSLIERLLTLAGKDKFALDERIGKGYILELCRKYGTMLIRGRFFSLGYPSIAHTVFVGSKVKVLEKRYLSVGSKAKLHDAVYIDALSTDGVKIGNNVVLGRNTRIECTGSLKHIGRGVKIGDRSTFGSDCFFGAAGGISIGNDVVCGQYIRFHSENHNFDNLDALIREQGVSHKGIVIGNNCWIGAGAVFLDGAELGDGCVVAANAVITKKFRANSVIGGVPAKVLRERGSQYG